MRKKSHPDAIATLDFLARVASAYALVTDGDTTLISSPAITWWNLKKIYEVIPAITEPRWILWVDDVNNGIWPDAPDSELAEICMALQSFPSGTLVINFKKLCDLREVNAAAVRLEKGTLRQYILDEHNRLRSDKQLVHLLSDENKLVLHNAVARDADWFSAWLNRPGAQVEGCVSYVQEEDTVHI